MSFPNPFDAPRPSHNYLPPRARVAEAVLGRKGLEVFDDLAGDEADEALSGDTDREDFALSSAEQALHERLEDSEKLFDEAAVTIGRLTERNNGMDNPRLKATGLLIGALRSVRLPTERAVASFTDLLEERINPSGYEEYARGDALLLSGDRANAEAHFQNIDPLYRHPVVLANLGLLDADARQGMVSDARVQTTYNAFVNTLENGHVPSFVAESLHRFLRTYVQPAGIDVSILCQAVQKSVTERDRRDEETDREYSMSKEALEAVTTFLQLDRPQDIETLTPLITYQDHPIHLHLALAEHAVTHGNVAGAEHWFSQVVEKIDDAVDASVIVEAVRVARCFPDQTIQLDKIEQALADDPFDDGIRLAPVYAALTNAHIALNHREKAERHFSKLEQAEAKLAKQFQEYPSSFNQVSTYASLAQASAVLGLDPKPAIRTLQSRFLLPSGEPHPRFTDTFVIPDWHRVVAASIEYDVDPMPLLRAMKTHLIKNTFQDKDLFQIAVHEITWAKHMVEKTRKEAQN